MNWTRTLLAGVVGGVALNITDYVNHGLILGSAYTKYPEVFSQEQAKIAWFFGIAILVGIFTAALFGKTRDAWADGLKGGLTFGFWLGMVLFWVPFYSVLVIDGFPYHLAWCHGGSNLIGFLVLGAVLGVMVKKS